LFFNKRNIKTKPPGFGLFVPLVGVEAPRWLLGAFLEAEKGNRDLGAEIENGAC